MGSQTLYSSVAKSLDADYILISGFDKEGWCIERHIRSHSCLCQLGRKRDEEYEELLTNKEERI